MCFAAACCAAGASPADTSPLFIIRQYGIQIDLEFPAHSEEGEGEGADSEAIDEREEGEKDEGEGSSVAYESADGEDGATYTREVGVLSS